MPLPPADSRPAAAPKVVETSVRVRYAETDQMGVVYHANYIIWMEVGRVEYFRSLNLCYRDLERDEGIILAVAEANCRYKAPALYDEVILIRTSVNEINARFVRFDYELVSAESGRLLATGYTKHVFCGRNLRPMRLPEKLHAALGITSTSISTTSEESTTV